jgi:uncharacterized SAM-binding protein YcdF (DUF218 family)
MDIILHLGGNVARAHTAAKLAQAFPYAKVVVSSELGDFQSIYNSYGVAPDRIIVDMQAWDTVTNFTHTCKLLQTMSCERLFVVTDQFHCYRSMLIALCVWGGKVPIYICPHDYSTSTGDERIALWNFVRALLWRLSGILLYEKSVKEARSQYFSPSSGHSLLEIGL